MPNLITRLSNWQGLASVILVVLTLATSNGVKAQDDFFTIVTGSVGITGVELSPPVVLEGQPFEIIVTGRDLTGGSGSEIPQPLEELEVTLDGNRIEVRFRNQFDACIFNPGRESVPLKERPPSRKVFSIPPLAAGTYTVVTRIGAFCTGPFPTERLVTVYPQLDNSLLRFNPESPAAGEIVSGVGTIRGWACYDKSRLLGSGVGGVIGKIEYQIDDGERQLLPYGSSRTDTAVVCGDGNTDSGYASAVYWGSLASGEHTFSLFIDGVLSRSHEFFVAEHGQGFLQGIQFEDEIRDFPTVGRSVRVRWSEAAQNFVIIDYGEGSLQQ